MTRKATFLQRRAKYSNKHRREQNRKFSSYKSGIGHDGPRKTLKSVWTPGAGKQREKTISSATNAAEGPGVLHVPPFIVRTGGTGYGSPVHQHVDHAHFASGDPTPAIRKSIAWYSGHQRRRKYIGHKPGRLNGEGRRRWGAALFHFLKGYWPDWDPDGRHPNDTGVNTPPFAETPDPLGFFG